MTHSPSLDGFTRLLDVVARLRDPDTGCPWDLKQTHSSLRPYMLEEAYEAVETMDSGDMAHLREELGDVLLQVVLHAQIAQDNGHFTADDVARQIADKLVHRHPHVFGDVEVANAEEVTANWEKIKQAEKGNVPQSAMDGIPTGLPALSRALKASKKAVKEGFEWPDFDSLWACVMSEYDEFLADKQQGKSQASLEEEMGDILFATVNLARYHDIDPEVALTKATSKFIHRYRKMETLSDKPLSQQPFDVLDDLWNQAKRALGSEQSISS